MVVVVVCVCSGGGGVLSYNNIPIYIAPVRMRLKP